VTAPPELPSSGLFDFNATTGFARAYLHTYYGGEPPIDEQLLSRFLVREAARLPRGRFLEIGCGPTIHHLLPIAPHVEEIHMLDYLEENLAEVQRWREAADNAHDWRPFTRRCLLDAGLPASGPAVEALESLLRSRIVRLGKCNLMQATPASDRHAYAAVGCFYCAEEVGISPAAWEEVVGRVADHVAPGGTLLMAALANMSSYAVEDATGRITQYPCACITEDDLRSLLPRLGFPAEGLRLESHEIDHPDVGVTATLMLAARKGPG
jgi:hypothetical protein